MTALKSGEVESFLARPDPARPVILVFGPDAGLVRERAQALVRSAVPDPDDPFALVPIEGDTLASEPSRLAEEAHTVPLFGGQRAIWVKPSSRNFAAAVEPLLQTPPVDCRVVIEAGDLRKTAPLRSMCERSRSAAVIACYADTERDLLRLIDDEMRKAALKLAPEARTVLASLIGGDRRASRGEIEKLILYAHGKDSVTLDDIAAVTADASALALDAVIDAAFAGRPAESEAQFAKALGAGTSSGTIIYAALRHATQMHKARVSMEGGEGAERALYGFVPPVHFRRKARVEAALAAWSSARLLRAVEQLADAMLTMRRSPQLADAVGQRAMLSLSVAARRKN